MPPVPGKFVDYWTNAKAAFGKATKTPKPSETWLWFRKGVGVQAALKKVDAAAPKAYKDPASNARFTTAWNAWHKVFETYETTLNVAIKAVDTDGKKLPKGVTTTAYKNALKKLNDELNAIHRVSLAYSANAIMAAGIAERTAQALERADEFIEDVQSDPRPEVFNKDIQERARDLTQEIGNVTKLKNKGMDTGRRQPTGLFKVLSAWGDQGRRLADTASRQEVLLEVDAYAQAVEGVRRWHAE